ncbi:Protein LOW PSII ACCUMULATION 1-like [Sesbania bispinosa]|nr:Protein LOW PSII ACCUMULATION 1-like [Sesbania bispinosa]
MALAFGSLTPNSNTLRPQPFNLITSNFTFTGRGVSYGHTLFYAHQRASIASIVSSASNKPSSSSEIRFYLPVMLLHQSLIIFVLQLYSQDKERATQLIGALANPSRASEVPEIAKGLGIDIGAVSLFAFLYFRENKAKNAQVARLTREEILSNLKLRVDEKKIIPVSSLRGIARLVICAGPASFITESFKSSEPFTERAEATCNQRKRLWQLAPVYISEWSGWLDEQKKLAGVSSESPVYLSLRMDGRVRGSGVGYPPWNAIVAQLPPIKGIWTGLLDGMDGRVL